MKRIVFFAFVAMLVMPLAPAASGTTAPTDRDAMAQATGAPKPAIQKRAKRPRINVRPIYPRQNTVSFFPRPFTFGYPGPNARRECVSRYVTEHRPSGTVVVPRMRCWWVKIGRAHV